jgi:hypothetical protein
MSRNSSGKSGKTYGQKSFASTVAVILMLSITASIIAVPIADAHVPPWTIKVEVYVSISPVTVGVNQQLIIVIWSNQLPVGTSGTYGYRYKFYADITKPDGTKQTLGPITSDPVGSSWTLFYPDKLGTYSIQARLPPQSWDGLTPTANAAGTMSTNANVNDTYYANPSRVENFTVVQQQTVPFQETPLPTNYWTRPVYGSNREWGQVMGEWLGGPFNTYLGTRTNIATDVPGSAHVLWSRPTWLGGEMGEAVGGLGTAGLDREYYTGQSYESYSAPSICVDGKLFYSVNQPPRFGWYCVDLYTGKTLYWQNYSETGATPSMPSMGQTLNIDNPNQHGGFTYLWRTSGVTLEAPNTTSTTTWEMLDAYSGHVITRIANVSTTGTQFADKIGSICYVSLATSNNTQYLRIWNTTDAIIGGTTATGTPATTYWSYKQSPVQTTPGSALTHAGRTLATGFDGGQWGWSLNVSLNGNNGRSQTIGTGQTSIYSVKTDEFVIGGRPGTNTGNASELVMGVLWKLSLKPGDQGKLLWNFTFTPPSSSGGNYTPSFTGVDPDSGTFYFSEVKTQTRWGYSMDQALTGKAQGTLLWTGQPEGQFNYYGMSNAMYKGRLYSYGYSGELIAYNASTGHVDWKWSAPYYGFETPYQHTPLSLGFAADGYLFMYTSEHSPTMPLRRDARLYAVNAETGQLNWSLQAWPTSSPIISDERIVYEDLFDTGLWCLGRGPSATTVTAPQTVPVQGSSIMITGTVTDQTPTGRLNTNAAGTAMFNSADNTPESGTYDFTLKGTPAISDADQGAWMEYMYQYRPMPKDAKGVPVKLTAIDPNGNLQNIGVVTSDNAGNFGISWTPPVPGTYQITATFEGSAAYGSSFATTYFAVGPAASAAVVTPAPTQGQTTAPSTTPTLTTSPSAVIIPPNSASPTTTYIAIGAAVIIVVAAAAALALRRRK